MHLQGGKKERRDVLHAGDVEAASIEELNQKIGILEKEKNKEEEYRNYMQLERASTRNYRHSGIQIEQWTFLRIAYYKE